MLKERGRVKHFANFLELCVWILNGFDIAQLMHHFWRRMQKWSVASFLTAYSVCSLQRSFQRNQLLEREKHSDSR